MSRDNRKIAWTPAQIRAIEADPHCRLLVDAGPGTGKTATACARVAWLIESRSVEPNTILMTSFTNAAIHEIVKRIGTHMQIPERALEIKISTLDSFAGSLNSGFSSGKLENKGYTENIKNASELLSFSDESKEYLKEIKHFIVDEAQDITGPRANLILNIINNLSEDCGVSVFSDEAQAIYGFTEDETPEYFGNTLPMDIRADAKLKSTFKSINLEEVHRTSDEKLKKLFSEGRQMLLKDKVSTIDKIYENVRELVIDSHHEKVGTPFEVLITKNLAKNLKESDFLLFRKRSEALQASQYMSTIPYRLRLSGFPILIDSWIARCFWDFTEDRISHSDFADLYRKRTGVKDDSEIEKKWRDLNREVGTDTHRISVRKLCNLLSRPNIPSCFSSPDYGVKGPILGTIHASKGRETEKVWLFVPSQPNFERIQEEEKFEAVLEEARILFVGATRSRNTLVISDTRSGNSFRRSGNLNASARAFTIKDIKTRKCAIELGRKGDIKAASLVGNRLFANEGEAILAQKALWNRRDLSVPLRATSSKEKDYLFQVNIDYEYTDPLYKDLLVEQKFDDVLFHLDQSINADIFRVGKIMGQKLKPPMKFRHFYSLGARTIAIATDDPSRELLHEPWSQSGFVLAPIMVGYPDIYLYGYRG